MRIFVGPIEIGGIGKGLVRGLEQLNQDAQLVLSIKHSFDYGNERDGIFFRLWQYLGVYRVAKHQYFFSKVFFVVLHRTFGFLFLIWAVLRYDSFLFLFGRTITDTKLELILLRHFKKKIVFINMGSDIRPPYMDGMNSIDGDLRDWVRLSKLTAKFKQRAILHERYADYIVSQPSISHFYQNPFINWFSMGIPQAFDIQIREQEAEVKRRLRVLHSPSNAEIKGSKIICEVIEQLIEEGVPLELIHLHGVSNNEVLHQLQLCDFVVDQLYSDIPMGVLASEAARFGKPAIVAGYMADQVDAYILRKDLPPSLYVRPEQLRDTIKTLVEDSELRLELGIRAREFVVKRWSSKAVAERYLMLLTGQAQSDWWFDPIEITYTGGCGMHLDRTSNNLDLIIKGCGIKALQVHDKPKLEQALLDLSRKKFPVQTYD